MIFLLLQQLFDSLYSISNDELLLLKKFETTHLSTCQTVKAASNRFIDLIEKFLPVFWNSKVLFLACISFSINTVLSLSYSCVLYRRNYWIINFSDKIEI